MKFLAICVKKLYDENKKPNTHSNIEEGVHMDYKERVIEILQKIHSEESLKKIYRFIKYIYIHGK